MTTNNKIIKIIIATHKKYQMPRDEIYLPLQVGAKGKKSLGYMRDDIGENISIFNPLFCELTGLYWAWKNIDYDYLGLTHYRRHFSKGFSKNKWKRILDSNSASKLCDKYDIILPKKRHYYIESLYSHYKHTHYEEHLIATRDILLEKYPDYITYYDKAVKKTSGHMFNMFIMRKQLVNEYCTFIFDILFSIKEKVDYSSLSPYHARFLGRISEIMLNAWILKKMEENPNLKIKELDYVYMEKIDWEQKIITFLRAKYLGAKYHSE